MKQTHLLLAVAVVLVLILSFSASNSKIQKDLITNQSTIGFIEPAMEFDRADMMLMNERMGEKVSAIEISPGIPPFPTQTAGDSAAEVEQRIIKTANLDLKVDSSGEIVSKIIKLAEEQKGFVQSSSVWEEYDGTKTGSVTIKVPSATFESTIAQIKTFALVVETETIQGQDVTEEFSDLQAQLRNAIKQEETFLSILDQATNVQDVLSVQRELGNIRSQIERLEGRVKYLENRTSLSTITVSLTEETTVSAPTKMFRPGSAVRDAMQTLVNLGQELILNVIYFAIVGGGILLVLLPIIILVTWVIVAKLRKKKK